MSDPVQVRFGVNSIHEASFVGRSVDEVLSLVAATLNIPAGSTAMVDGRQVAGSTVLQAAQTLEFVKPMGQKGSHVGCKCVRSNFKARYSLVA